MSERELITFRNVQKSLLRRKVIDVDELVVYRSECAVVHGENGAGKSTLMKIIAGLIAPDAGIVTVGGQRMTWRVAYRSFRKNVVYLHQSPYLFDRSVAENISYGLSMRRLGRSEVRERVHNAMQWAGLSQLAYRNARDLSGGERQRVALTRARILEPRLLLLDEPTSAMDHDSREQAFELIRDLADSGITVYISTHESAQHYQPDRIIKMANGQLL
ncbi:MAG: ABC transporter ATP-binding protein [Acidiferrobacterales bacterium]|nr:ABC transporter ATP-binding protein [Acidiferrobacterales bacterium]